MKISRISSIVPYPKSRTIGEEQVKTLAELKADIAETDRMLADLQAQQKRQYEALTEVLEAQPDEPLNTMEQMMSDWLAIHDSELLTACMKMRRAMPGWDLMDCCDYTDSRTYNQYCNGWHHNE